MKKQPVMRVRGFRIEERQYKHLTKKAGKHGTPSAEVRELIDADMKPKQGAKK
jgi:hypothetical protein